MSVNSDTYYRDHWVEIEPERLEAYEQMFEWRPQNAPRLGPARLAPGQVVVDYGCGPGGLAVELARRVAPGGRVHGVDLNKAFLERAAARAKRDGVEASVSWHHARLLVNGGVTIEDLGSTNGTFVNGKRAAGRVVLKAGDRLELGKVSIVFDPSPARGSGTVKIPGR